MLAWRKSFTQPSPFLAEIPLPTPHPDQLLVKISAMGVCHSDCTLLHMPAPIYGMRPEYTMGHEACGSIVSLGSSVPPSLFSPGDMVGLLIIPGCGASECAECAKGLNRLCKRSDGGNYGLGLSDGFFAEYAVVTWRAAIKIPEGLGVEVAAVSADAVLTAYHAVRYTGAPEKGDTIAILGLGGVGLNGLQTVLYLGVAPERIYVVDKRQTSLDQAVKLGVPRENAFLAGGEEGTSIEKFVEEKGVQVDVVFDFAGHEQTMTTAQMVVRAGGTIVLIGLMSATVPIFSLVSVLKGVTVKMGYNGPMEAFGECLELMAKGVLKPVVETGSINSLPKVLEDLDEGRINNRMVLLPDWSK